jgi:hypothetical protein
MAENPTANAIAAYAVTALAMTITAYFAIFTIFQPYDDEGTLLVTLKAFIHGEALYRDIWSVYGPFYYELFGGFFSLTGSAITTDASRSIVIVLWVVTSLMFGLAAQRMTGRLALGVLGMITAFATLGVLVNEPMHPQALCVLLLGGFVLLATAGWTRRTAWAGAGCGALLAALVLTKVNLGVLAIAAIVLAAALMAEPLQRRGWLRWLVVAGFLALPLAILARDLKLVWVREFLLIEVLCSAAIVVAAWPQRPRSGEDDPRLRRWLLAAAAGFAAALLAIVFVILLTGPSLGDLYHGVVKEAFRVRDVLTGQLLFPGGSAVDWSIAAVVAAAIASRWRAQGVGSSSIWPGLLRLAAGLAIWLGTAHVLLLGLNPSSGYQELVPSLLAWVAVIPPAGAAEPAHRRFLRVMLAALALTETLQVYPVPGSQLGIAGVTFVPVGAICLADALTELRAWSVARGAAAAARFRLLATTVSVALVGVFALNSVALTAISDAILYHAEPKLPLPGAELMHLSAPQVDAYTEMVTLLHEHHCTTFIGYPNVNSLYLWSGYETLPPVSPNAWMYSLDDSQQQRVVDEMRASPRPCAIRNEELATPYLKGLPPPQTPLVDYVFHQFRPVATAGPFEFMLPKPGATGG